MSRNSNAKIWDYFDKDPISKLAVCNFCKNRLSYKTTITNLKQHLKNKHLNMYNELLQNSGPSAAMTVRRSASLCDRSGLLNLDDSEEIDINNDGSLEDTPVDSESNIKIYTVTSLDDKHILKEFTNTDKDDPLTIQEQINHEDVPCTSEADNKDTEEIEFQLDDDWKELVAKTRPRLMKTHQKRPFGKIVGEKMRMASIQKQILAEELEYKIIQKRIISEELEHKRKMQKMEKHHMQLKIEILKTELDNLQ